MPENKYSNEAINQNLTYQNWENFVGLSWILLEKEEEY